MLRPFDGVEDVDTWIAHFQEANREHRVLSNLDDHLINRARLWFRRVSARDIRKARSIITLREAFGSQPIVDPDLSPAERAYNTVKQDGSVWAYACAFRDAAREFGQDLDDLDTRLWFYFGLKDVVRWHIVTRVWELHTFETLAVEAIRGGVPATSAAPGTMAGLSASVRELQMGMGLLQERLGRLEEATM